ALVGVWRENDLRAMPAHQVDDLQFFLARGAHAAIAEVEVLAKDGAEDAGGFCGLPRALVRRAARPHLAAGEVDHPDAQTVLDRPGDGAAARQLRVIGVRGDEEEVTSRRLCRP